MKHVLIITGGYLDMEFAKAYSKTLFIDKVFVVDKGLEYADMLGILPDYIVGDFDTVDSELLAFYEEKIAKGEIQACIERHPVQKDATDTELAVRKAIEEQAQQITILAATGNRLDHVLSNLGLLQQTADQNIDCQIVDADNRIRLLLAGEQCNIKKKNQYGVFLSLIPVTSVVKGLTITGVLYPLQDKTVLQGSSFTVSNQIVEETAVITAKEGNLLVIESKDG